MLRETIESLDYILYDVIYVKEGKDYFLRILIDHPQGISLDDCENVSNAISDILDEEDLIKEQYFLEVSSAGVERVLRSNKHLQDNIGKDVEIKLFKPIDKSKVIEGTLKEFDENNICIMKDEKILEINRENIAIIKTIYKW